MKPEEEITQHKIDFLRCMNQLLVRKEKELYKRCKLLNKSYRNRLVQNGGDLNDYEIDLVIQYNITGCHPKYIYHRSFAKGEIGGGDIDYKEKSFPEIGEPWGYLMHALYEHTGIGNTIFKITDIEFELLIREQQRVKVIEQICFS